MRVHDLVGPGGLLAPGFPLPLDRPFTRADACRAGLSDHDLMALTQAALLRHPLRGVYLAAQAADTLQQRVDTVALVLPPGGVVTDRTAAYLHGVDILQRTARETPPPISVFRAEGTRVRRQGVGSGSRMLSARDVTEVGGVPVTTPLRTACDLGRLLWRYDALASLDLFVRHGVAQEAIVHEAGRFSGYRWIRQLRTLAPLADGRSESPGESALRLHWLEAGLPDPVPQLWVEDDDGVPVFRLDLTLPEIGYAAEYDGEEFHTDPDARAHDAARRTWLGEERGWQIDVFTRSSVYGLHPDAGDRLRSGVLRARRRMVRWKVA